jgi:hypothetical protein
MPRLGSMCVTVGEQVVMFVDVAEDKITRGAYNHGITGLKPTPVLHFSKVQLPVVRSISCLIPIIFRKATPLL